MRSSSAANGLQGSCAGLNVHIQGNGPLFVWGHGLLGSMRSEERFALFDWSAFPQDLCLLRYDARGHGASEPGTTPAAYAWPALGQDMQALAEANAKGQPYVLGGQSMGCASALFAALESPTQVSALVLVNPPTAWQTRAAQGAYYRRGAWLSGILGGTLLAKSMRKRLARLWPYWLLAARPEQARLSLESIGQMKRRTLFNVLSGAAASDLPSAQALATLTMPVLILAWSDDQSHPLQTAEALARLLPQAQLRVAGSNEEIAQWPQWIAEFVRLNARQPDQPGG